MAGFPITMKKVILFCRGLELLPLLINKQCFEAVTRTTINDTGREWTYDDQTVAEKGIT